MKKSRKLLVAGILTLTAVAGVSLYAYADNSDESILLSSNSSASDQTAQVSDITAENASETAISSAVSEYGIQESTVRDLEVEREYENGKVFWEVTFDAEDENSRYCEFEYWVSYEDGTVTYHDMEYEDRDDQCEMDDASSV
jgi:hypothetical protein